MSPAAIDAVLFDLDGTLIDSAPDLAGAANDLRTARGLAELPIGHFRPHAGSGARGMVRIAFDVLPGDRDFEALRTEFLVRYAQRFLALTRVFDGIWPMLDAIEASGRRWGIVTNKAVYLASPIVDGLGLGARSAVLIGGDSTSHAKPHPAPLLEAAHRIGCEPARCLYVGDDPRDVQAGRAAGMGTLAAAWGYLGVDHPVHAWGADAVLDRPGALLHQLHLA
jgi:phosphoglycolate phosphatase